MVLLYGSGPSFFVDLFFKLLDDDIVIGDFFGLGGEFFVEGGDTFLFDTEWFGGAFI